MLTQEQLNRALEVMREYLAAPQNPDGRTPEEVQSERDERRAEIIENVMHPLLTDYIDGAVSLADFKSKVDSINKRNPYWGFKGIKGQMFFNMVVNVAGDEEELEQELKTAIAAPSSERLAASHIRNFVSYVRRLGDDFVASGGSPHGRPKISSVPFFLSYFWQIQDPNTWPVYFTNSVQVMGDLNLWQPSGEFAADYVAFKQIHEELAKAFSKESDRTFAPYEVEHVFWFKGGNPFGGDHPLAKEGEGVRPPMTGGELLTDELLDRLPESFVPPIVQVIPRLARNDESLVEAANASGTNIPRALEKNIDAALTVLGYDTKLLGQGQGRVPDGIAVDIDNSYAIIWDAKARNGFYSMGTDDRTIREYIVTQSRELRRRRNLRNVYYVIVSSAFADDYDDPVRTLKMETDVSEVILLEADALVAMVDAKLRSPLQLTLGPDGLQRLFTASAVLSAEMVKEMVG